MSNEFLRDAYLEQVSQAVDEVYPADKNKPSIYRDTTSFFINDAKNTREQLDLKIKIAQVQDELADARQHDEVLEKRLMGLIASLDDSKQKDATDRHNRLNRVRKVCQTLYQLCEGKNPTETQQKTAKFLAALWLISENHQGDYRTLHQRLKAPYKVAITLRFIDDVLRNQLAQVPNWESFTDPDMRYKNEQNQQRWFAAVAMPIMMAALFQDAGLQHPLALRLLNGARGELDPFRVLNQEERPSLLKMNYRFSVDYVTLGLGVDYATNYASPEEQILAHATTLEVVKDAYKPMQGIGELIKIPQIYASVVFSTKQHFVREDVPKDCMLVDQLGKKGVLQPALAKSFSGITGLFPQGFGVLNQDYKGMVYGLNPNSAHEPHCLPLLDHNDALVNQPEHVLAKAENFYFTSTRKQFSVVEKAKIDVLVKPNNTPPDTNFWQPSQYFTRWQPTWAAL
ncbi:hypothetical protein [Alteromonas oceanisediminis]|uniref:hypothetical protein n=1 Tax=Alteromonas oceanisediminis TaxID=2836180 RepID=UPI001BD9D2CF|nr:hypothetical protein [Alteromonas oceanisediminis]MBT0587451.1 hypothetical protein [Alteromonas oceanisediminis]